MGADSSRFTKEMALNTSLGQGGSTFISDTAAHTFPNEDEFWACVIPKEDTVFGVLTDFAGRDGNSIVAEVFPAGYPIYGAFTAITLVSGACMAYKVADWKLGGGG